MLLPLYVFCMSTALHFQTDIWFFDRLSLGGLLRRTCLSSYPFLTNQYVRMLFSSMKKGTDLVFIIEENFPHLPVYQKNQN